MPVIEQACAELDNGYRVMAQTSLGELLTTSAANETIAKAAFASINSKRLDIAVIDRGVDGIISDYPDRARDALMARGRRR